MAPTNRLFCGDNLQVLREHVADESIDLCYIDPPFFSQRQHRARLDNGGFSDLWKWDDGAQADLASLCAQPTTLALLLAGLEPVVGRRSLLAYLVSVGRRLIELERVLRPTGSLF